MFRVLSLLTTLPGCTELQAPVANATWESIGTLDSAGTSDSADVVGAQAGSTAVMIRTARARRTTLRIERLDSVSVARRLKASGGFRTPSWFA